MKMKLLLTCNDGIFKYEVALDCCIASKWNTLFHGGSHVYSVNQSTRHVQLFLDDETSKLGTRRQKAIVHSH